MGFGLRFHWKISYWNWCCYGRPCYWLSISLGYCRLCYYEHGTCWYHFQSQFTVIYTYVCLGSALSIVGYRNAISIARARRMGLSIDIWLPGLAVTILCLFVIAFLMGNWVEWWGWFGCIYYKFMLIINVINFLNWARWIWGYGILTIFWMNAGD